MRALTWQGPGAVSVETVSDPTIEEPTDAVIRVTSTAICGSDLHLYGVFGPFLRRGDILRHEAMGVVIAVGSDPVPERRALAERYGAATFDTGGTLSLSGVYAGAADPLPMITAFDKQLTLRTGQCNVQHWVPDLLPLVEDPADPLGTQDLVTHRVPLEEAPRLYDVFRRKADGCVKVVLTPQ